jgi:hypothetical protein
MATLRETYGKRGNRNQAAYLKAVGARRCNPVRWYDDPKREAAIRLAEQMNPRTSTADAWRMARALRLKGEVYFRFMAAAKVRRASALVGAPCERVDMNHADYQAVGRWLRQYDNARRVVARSMAAGN